MKESQLIEIEHLSGPLPDLGEDFTFRGVVYMVLDIISGKRTRILLG